MYVFVKMASVSKYEISKMLKEYFLQLQQPFKLCMHERGQKQTKTRLFHLCFLQDYHRLIHKDNHKDNGHFPDVRRRITQKERRERKRERTDET